MSAPVEAHPRALRVLLAPDSFKGSATAVEVCAALTAGWTSVRPQDDLVAVPFSDGGEGLVDAVAAAVPGARRHRVPGVCGPDGRSVDGEWLQLPDGTAVVELARASGLPLMSRPDVWAATTRGTGQVLRAATEAGARRVALGLGGSAGVDGGLGVLRALGPRVLDAAGRDVAEGATGLASAAAVVADGLLPPPPDGLLLLTDVVNPLLGPDGAAAVFGPQKGAGPADVAALEDALRRWAALLGVDPTVPGLGAAGGVAAALRPFWPTTVVAGAPWLADVVDLPRLCAEADLVVTGEGCYDRTSLSGKVVGHVLAAAAAARTPAAIAAGAVRDTPPPDVVGTLALLDLAPDERSALDDAPRWLEVAGARLASGVVGRLAR